MGRALRLAATVLALLAAGGCVGLCGRSSEPEVLTEFVKSAAHPRNSEGDVIRLSDGRLLIVYSHFYRDANSPFPDGGYDNSSAELVLTESSDGGRTWSPIRTVVRKPAGALNVMSASFLRLGDGRLALFYLVKRSTTDCRPVMVVSSDDGKTWSDPVLCIADSDVAYYVMNNARAVLTEKGRILLPMAQYRLVNAPKEKRQTERSAYMACAISDDGGVTWRLSADRKRPSPAEGKGRVYLEEPGIVRLKDGRLMMYARSNERCQWCLYSTDDGEHWTDPERITTYATTTNSPVTYERLSTGELVVVLNDADEHPVDEKVVEYERRWPFGVAVSSDEGRTWKKKLLERDVPGLHCCYCAAREIDGRLILVYCHRDALATTRVMSVPLGWLPR